MDRHGGLPTPTPSTPCPGGGKKGSNHVDDHIYTVPAGRPDHRRAGPPARRRPVPDGHEHLVRQPPAAALAGLLRDARPHLLPRPADPARAVAGLDEPRRSPSRGSRSAPGDQLRLRAVYDNQLPHTRVMSILMAYLAARRRRAVRGAARRTSITQDVPRRFRKPYPPATRAADGAAEGRVQAVRRRDRRGRLRLRAAARRRRSAARRSRGASTAARCTTSSVANGPRALLVATGSRRASSPTRRRQARHLRPLLHAAPGLMSQELKVE